MKSDPIDIYYHDSKQHRSRGTAAARVARLGRKEVQLPQDDFPGDNGVDVCRPADDVFEWPWSCLSATAIGVFDDCRFPAVPEINRFFGEPQHKPDPSVVHDFNGHGCVVER